MKRIMEQIESGVFDPAKELTGSKDKFLEVKTMIESISEELSKDACIKLVATKLLPQIFSKNVDDSLRDRTTEVGLHLVQFVNILILSTKEQDDLISSIEDTYIPLIGELRDNNYHKWDNLWIFLIKFCSYKIHTKMSLANKLLRVVEVAFRNSTSIDQRLKAYDCWIELINNSSLNMEHMCSAKQIKLLMTPMKAKFSRMPVVIMKRCDTFVYLLEKLQDKATLCLKEFLEFCFGPFDEKNDEKMKQGRSVPEVCNKSTRVLLEILGHSHENGENCLANDDLHLCKPFITNNNFPNFAEILIQSVVECYILLNEWSQDTQKNNIIIKCLWRSILQFIDNSDDDVKKTCRNQINNALKKLLEKSRSKDTLHIVLANMVNLIIPNEMAPHFKETIFDVSLYVLNHLTDFSSLNLNNIKPFVVSCFDPPNGSNFDKTACNSFKTNMKIVNSILCEIWLKCKITILPDNLSTLIWPVRHYRSFTDAEAVKSKWNKIYSSECKTDAFKINVLNELEKLFLENPLLSSNIVEFLALVSAREISPSKDFVYKFMRLNELVLSLPNLSDLDVNKVGSLVLNYCNQNQHFYKIGNNDEALDKICVCLERLVTVHKDFRILKELPDRLKNSSPINLAKFSKRLMSFLEGVMLSEDIQVVSYTRKLIEVLESGKNEPEPTTPSRSHRLLNMANLSKSKRLTGPKLSPLSAKSSPATTRSKKNLIKKKEVIQTPDNSSDFVKIDTEVKISIENLSERQLEMFRKRREDIPALYNDLTQSQSQDFFTSLEKKKEAEAKSPKEEKSLPKKRKRNEQDDESKSKIPKLQDHEYIADTETVPLVCSDLNEMFEIPLEPVQKVPPEDLFQETPILRETQVNTEINGSPSKLKVKSPEKKCPESPSRKSPRISPKKTESMSSLIKELDALLSSKQNSLKEEENAVTNGDHGEDDTKTVGETLLRKSQRQVNKRHSDFVLALTKKETPEGKVKANRSLVESTENGFKIKNALSLRKKKQKDKRKEKQSTSQTNGEDTDTNVSMTELLARVDKRIEENKNLEKSKEAALLSLQDGNQNQIVTETKKTDKPKENELKMKIDTKTQSVVPKPVYFPLPETDKIPKRSVDVFEFNAQETSPSPSPSESEARKRKKKKSGGMGLTRSDYVNKKRRKKPLKDQKEKASPNFHVTADSKVPLSRSPSLRAVPSPVKSETITILITRSPPNVSKENQDDKIDETPASATRKSNRRLSQNSEDVIESSQQPVSIKRLRTKNGRFIQGKIDTMIKPTPDAVLKKNDTEKMSSDLFSEKENEQAPTPVSRTRRLSLTEPSQNVRAGRIKRSQSLDKLVFTPLSLCLRSKASPVENKVNDSSTETLTATTDSKENVATSTENQETLTLSPVESATKDDLPGSPVTCDTPDRTSELLNNTSNISPINCVEESVQTPKQPTSEVSNVRVARLLKMVNSHVQVNSDGPRWFGNKHSSPRGKVRKMKMKKGEDLDVLTFSREIPSPLTVPTSGILKRKFPNLEEASAPSPKRKRVNFSDPAISDKKVFIKDSEEYEVNDKNLTSDSTEEKEPFNREEALVSFKEFCDSSFKDDSEVRSTLLNLKEVPELEDVITQSLDSSQDSTKDTSQKLRPKLLKIAEKLSDDLLQVFIKGFSKVVRGTINDTLQPEDIHKQIEDHVVKLNCDKMKDLIKTYFLNLDNDDRNDFLVSLMSLASNELPVKKEFINCHLDLVQSFINKMDE